jgi:glucose-1-phosphate thymidylyltransferase
MIFYPIEALVQAGIDEVMVVTGGEHAGDFLRLLKNGEGLGLRHLEFGYQEGHGGIAEALKVAEDFADDEPICVMLGDNIFQKSIRPAAEVFARQPEGARLVLSQTSDPHRFGVPAFGEGGRIEKIVEKPSVAPALYAVTGAYFYDHRVFEICKSLEKSERGELEISDVNNQYLIGNRLTYEVQLGWWIDAGTVENLYAASTLVRSTGANNNTIDDNLNRVERVERVERT